jgi:hypothetical protein
VDAALSKHSKAAQPRPASETKVCLRLQNSSAAFHSQIRFFCPPMTLVLDHTHFLHCVAVVPDDSFFYQPLFVSHILRQSMNKPSTVSIFRFCEACDEPG